jgi:hypothetical protein
MAKRSSQPDLFGDHAAQHDLFGPPEPTTPAVYVPKIEHVRNRLNAIMEQARAARTMPWESPQRKLYHDIVIPYLTQLLPDPGEAREYAEAFEKEYTRLMEA